MVKSSSRIHSIIIIIVAIIILLLIIEQYYLSSTVSIEPTLFHARCRPSPQLGLHHISSNSSHRNYPIPSLHFHDNNLHLLPSYRHIPIISLSKSSLLSCKRQNNNKQRIHGPPVFYQRNA